jgi:Na+/H+ antiporter NhaA
VRPRRGETHSRGEYLEHRLHPLSAGFAVPVFALAAAGISMAAVGGAISDSNAIGVFAGLLVGKVAGIYGGALLAVRLRLGTLPDQVRLADIVPLAMLGAIGYTVSPLIARPRGPRSRGAQCRERARGLGRRGVHRGPPAQAQVSSGMSRVTSGVRAPPG